MTTTDRAPSDGEQEPTAPDRSPLGGDFWKLLGAGTISNVGDGIDATALPLLASALTRDPVLFAGVAVASRVPWLLFALQAGALADRLDRRRVMIASNVFRAVLLGLLGAAVLTDVATIWLLYGTALGLGTAEVLFDTSAQALLPRVVRREQLERANGMQMGAELVANNFVGPPLGGLLFSVAAALPLLLDAGTFAVSAGLLALVSASVGRAASGRSGADPGHGPRDTPAAPEAAAPAPGEDTEETDGHVRAGSGSDDPPASSIRTEIREGLAWLRGNRLLWTLAVLLGLMNGTSMLGMSVFALYALEVLGVSEVQFGLLLTAAALGSVVGSALAARLVARFGRGPALWTTLVSAVAVPLTMGLTTSAGVVAAASVVGGFSAVIWNVITVSLRQTVIPDHLLGRVNAVYRFLGWGSMPLGAGLGGVVAQIGGLRAPFLVAAALMGLGLLHARGRITSAAIESARVDVTQR
jgi:MFS family permease